MIEEPRGDEASDEEEPSSQPPEALAAADEATESGGDTPEAPADEATESGGDTPEAPADEETDSGGDTPEAPAAAELDEAGEQSATAEPDETTEGPATAEPAEAAEASATGEPAEAAEASAAAEPAEPAEGSAPAQEPAPAPRERGGRGRQRSERDDEPEMIPGAHLEPDLVLEDPAVDRGALGDRVGAEIQAAEEALAAEDGTDAEVAQPEPSPQTVARTVLDLAADARYRATGKRKSAVARVTLRPGTGVYSVNGRELDVFFPRPTLQRMARDPLETVGQQERMDVVAKIHGGGVSSQAAALRHGIARALVEADPNLRSELKRRGFLTRDPRVKERKKAGLKKARKRPQFSKR